MRTYPFMIDFEDIATSSSSEKCVCVCVHACVGTCVRVYVCTFVAHERSGPRVHPLFLPCPAGARLRAPACTGPGRVHGRSRDMFTYALVMDEAEPPLVGFNNGVAATRLYLG